MKYSKDRPFSKSDSGPLQFVKRNWRACARFLLSLLVSFVSAQSTFAARVGLDKPSVSVTSFEKRCPFIPPATKRFKTMAVSADEKTDCFCSAMGKVFDTVLPVDYVAVRQKLMSVSVVDPPSIFLVLPLRI